MIDKFRLWIATLFLPANTARVLNAIRGVVEIVDVALPVVAHVNSELKPAIAAGEDPYEVLAWFLAKYKAEDKALELSTLPWDSLLHGAAVAAIEKLVVQPVPRSALRLGVEVAYWVYKVVKK